MFGVYCPRKRADTVSVSGDGTEGGAAVTRAGGKQVGVSCACTWEREALAAWLSRFGYPVVDVGGETTLVEPPAVVVVNARDRSSLARLHWMPAARIVVIGGPGDADAARSGFRHLPDGPDLADRLRILLQSLLGPAAGRVSLSPREREVLTSYVLGATVEETAAEHYVATSTVRTHYRRVTSRYTEAGRPVANKAQLLLRMIADGWIQLRDDVPTPAPLTADPADGARAERRRGAA